MAKNYTEVQIALKYFNKAESASKRGIPFTLTFKRMKQLFKQKTCYFTGVVFDPRPTPEHGVPHPHSRSLERIDNTLGYTDSNTIAITYELNRLKSNLSMDTIALLHKGCQKYAKRLKAKEEKTGIKVLRPIKLRKAV